MGEPLALRFANTRYATRGQPRDAIDTPELLRTWLTHHAGAVGAAGQLDVPAFVELRDTIRDLIAAGDRAPAHEQGVALLNRLSAGAPTWPALDCADGRFRMVERTTGDTQASALAALAQDAITLLSGDLAAGLRACQAPGCVQFFVKDTPRREWCSPACGNRARAARHYLRHRVD